MRQHYVRNALRESESRYRDLVENATDLIQCIAPDGSILFANAAWMKAIECSPAESKNTNFFDLIHPDKQDAWNKLTNVPVGAVYLRRSGEDVQALNVICPHAGCFVDLKTGANDASDAHFFCPCHNSSFALDGSIDDEKSPSPRPMDALETEIRSESEIWVRFQNFRSAQKEKEPVA